MSGRCEPPLWVPAVVLLLALALMIDGARQLVRKICRQAARRSPAIG